MCLHNTSSHVTLWLPRGVFSPLSIGLVVVLDLSVWTALKQPIYHLLWRRETELGRIQKAWTNTMLQTKSRSITSLFPSVAHSSLFDLSFLKSLAFFVHSFATFFSPTTLILLCPSFLRLAVHIMCEKRLKRVSFGRRLCLLLWLTKERWIPWYGHYFVQRVINETIRVFACLCVLFELNK